MWLSRPLGKPASRVMEPSFNHGPARPDARPEPGEGSKFMIAILRSIRAAHLAAAVAAALTLAACASNPLNQDQAGIGGAGAATPGSAQDFVVNVGDRVFFETDSTE